MSRNGSRCGMSFSICSRPNGVVNSLTAPIVARCPRRESWSTSWRAAPRPRTSCARSPRRARPPSRPCAQTSSTPAAGGADGAGRRRPAPRCWSRSCCGPQRPRTSCRCSASPAASPPSSARARSAPTPGLSWPNDVVCDEPQARAACSPSSGPADSVLLGIGMNLAARAADLPAGRPPRADLAAARDGRRPRARRTRSPRCSTRCGRSRRASTRRARRRSRRARAPLDALAGTAVRAAARERRGRRGHRGGHRRRRQPARARRATACAAYASGEVVRLTLSARLTRYARGRDPARRVRHRHRRRRRQDLRLRAARGARARGGPHARDADGRAGRRRRRDALADRARARRRRRDRAQLTRASTCWRRAAATRSPPVDPEHVREVYLALRGRSDGVLVEGPSGLLAPLGGAARRPISRSALGLPLVIVCRPGPRHGQPRGADARGRAAPQPRGARA